MKHLKVTEIHTLSTGAVRLVLADGRALLVHRNADNYSSTRWEKGDRQEDGHQLKVSDLPKGSIESVGF